MTLSNIFFGKKVVKQAYLNNALIYQSNGWQTLPSTCSEVWTKSYGQTNTIGAIVKDDLDNLYIGISNFLYKIDPDGVLEWKAQVNTTTITRCTIAGIAITSEYIYCSYYDNTGISIIGYVSKLDKKGNLISSTNVNTILTGISVKYFIDIKNDSNNIFAITNNYILKLDFDFKLIDYASVPNTATCLAVDNGPYIFVGTDNYGVRINKNNLKNSTNFAGDGSIALYTSSISLDSIGHVYFGSNNYFYLYKFDVNNCQIMARIVFKDSDSRCYAQCMDYQDNLYAIYYNSPNYLLRKYSSDGTLIWDSVQIPTTIGALKVITDSNGNIYIAYIDSNSMLTIKKLINLVKET